MEKSKQYMDMADTALLHAYNRYPVVFHHGKGVYLYDEEGKEYLDFAAGIAVCALGYGDAEYTARLKAQTDLLLHTSNLFYSAATAQAAAKLAEAAEMERVFFTNSGTEAIEGALKAARKYSFLKYGPERYEVIAMQHSFHGRSMGAVSVTGNAHYREPFEPLIGGVRFAGFNDLESVRAQITDKTCAILLETVQGEGGIYPATEDFLKGVKEICEENDILMILDEIQCGMGRTGRMFAWQEYGVKPDIMTVAKALGGGIPVGAFLLTEAVANASLVPGDHGTTYGGNPFAGAAVSAVFDIYKERNLLQHVREISGYLEEQLDALVLKHDILIERRGKGLMQGLVTTQKPSVICTKALEHGLVVISAGTDVIRLVPPLVIEKIHVDEMIQKLDTIFSEILCEISE